MSARFIISHTLHAKQHVAFCRASVRGLCLAITSLSIGTSIRLSIDSRILSGLEAMGSHAEQFAIFVKVPLWLFQMSLKFRMRRGQ